MNAYTKLYTIIGLFMELDEGCKAHHSYKAKRAPRLKSCTRCNELWEVRKQLTELLDETVEE